MRGGMAAAPTAPACRVNAIKPASMELAGRIAPESRNKTLGFATGRPPGVAGNSNADRLRYRPISKAEAAAAQP